MIRPLPAMCGCLVAMAAMPAPAASIGQATTPNGAAFTSACAGSQPPVSLTDPGSAYNGGQSSATVNCQSSTSAVGGSASSFASNSGTQNGYSFSNSAFASGSAGAVHLSSNNLGYADVDFPIAIANVGWNDSIASWSGPTGTWLAPLNIDGTLIASGFGALGRVGVGAYANNTWLQPDNTADTAAYNLFLANNSPINGAIYTAPTRQYVQYGVVQYLPNDPGSVPLLSVNGTLYFGIPVVNGQAVNFGFYIDTYASENSFGVSGIQNQATLDFANTLSWGGPGEVVEGDGTVVSNFTIGQSASGFDYNQAYSEAAPEPSTLLLLGTGLIVVLCSRALIAEDRRRCS